MFSKRICFLPSPSGGPGQIALFWACADYLLSQNSALSIHGLSSFKLKDVRSPTLHPVHSKAGGEQEFTWSAGGEPPFADEVLIIIRPLLEDYRALKKKLADFRTGAVPPCLRILIWSGDGLDYHGEDFFDCPVATVPLPLRELVRSEEDEVPLRLSSPRLFRKLHDSLAHLKLGLSENSRSEGESFTELSVFQNLILERFWKSLEDRSWEIQNTKSVEPALDQIIDNVILENKQVRVRQEDISKIKRSLLQELSGYGAIDELMEDPEITEIMVNGPNRIYFERNGKIEAAHSFFRDRKQLQGVIDRMVGAVGRRVDTSVPMCDLRLPNGARVNIVLPPLSLDWPVITIRRFRQDLKGLDDLVRCGFLTPVQADHLAKAVQSHANILISGNTGSGKTTLLNALSEFIDPQERIITLEDAAELNLRQPHVVRLETRLKNVEGAGAVSMSDLVINSLRMRPDRIIVGECRGPEVIPMLQAMNTGHDGSMTTLHSNSASDAISRLESMVLLGAPEWPLETVRRQIASGLDRVVHLHRQGAERKLIEMGRFVWESNGIIFVPDHLDEKNI